MRICGITWHCEAQSFALVWAGRTDLPAGSHRTSEGLGKGILGRAILCHNIGIGW